MDSAGEISSSSSAWASSNENENGGSNSNTDYINSIVLPPAFVADPASYLTSIASRPNPSPDGISLLAGPLSKWFLSAEEAHRKSRDTSNINKASMTAGGQNAPVHPATHVAQLYLCAAATQLREEHNQSSVIGLSSTAAAAVALASTSVASIAASATNAISREQEESKNRTARHRDETLEAVAAAAVLCSDRSAISSSGILPVLANLVATTSSSNTSGSPSAASSASNNKIASSIASSLSNLPSSSSKAFPLLTPAHTAFLQCAVLAEEYEFAETVVRGTWPLPTSTLKKKKGNGIDESHASISIILRYYYLRGIVHYGCGRDHYGMAHRCWWTCLSIPVDVVSAIAVQAWKKLTLVQPLLDTNGNNREAGGPSRADIIDTSIDGDTNVTSSESLAMSTIGKRKSNAHPGTRLPKCTPKGLGKSIRALIDTNSINTGKQERDVYSVYTLLGPAVEAVDRASAETLVREHESVLVADGNMEMARNCLKRVKDLQVRTASKMFSVTSIHILARRWKVTPGEASEQLSDAMELGVVPCRVQEDGTVLFLSPQDSQRNSSSSNLGDLTGWIKLLELMQRMDVDLSISSKFNTVKRKEDKSALGDMIGAPPPRGVEEFYSDPTM